MSPRTKSPQRRLRPLPLVLLLAGIVGSQALAQLPQLSDLRAHVRKPLKALRSCESVRSYVGDVVVETLVDQRYGNSWRLWDGWFSAPGGGAEAGSGPEDFTSTNNQEAGVDELDLVKTDGEHIYLALSDRLQVVRSWPAAESALLASLPLSGWASGLFLDGDRVLVVSSPVSDMGIEPGRWAGTRLDLVDVSDAAAPRTLRSLEVEGWMVGGRKIGSRVFLVVSSAVVVPGDVWGLIWREDLGLPEISSAASEEERQAAAAIARAILRPLVDGLLAPLEERDLLPVRRTQVPGDDWQVEPLLGCSDLYRPPKVSGLTLLTVLSLDLDTFADEGDVDSVGLLADGAHLYASSRSLYVAQPGFRWWWGWGELDRETAIHRFELSDDPSRPVRYAASGFVPGFLLDQFSMGEHQGYLRVASTDLGWFVDPAETDPANRVTVLRDDERGSLRQVGQVAGIAPREQIYAARFLGDKGYLVTFRQVDPLFALDLSDPAAPRIVGHLEIPGFSSYLHPIGDGDDYLLAVGRAGRDDGTVEGLAVNLFDVRDLAHPELAFQHVVEPRTGWAWSEALSDHHAFTYHRDTLSIPAYYWSETTSFSGLLVFLVDTERGIQELGRIDHGSMGSMGSMGGMGYEMPWVRRSVYIDDAIYSISDRGIKVNDLHRPGVLLADVPLR